MSRAPGQLTAGSKTSRALALLADTGHLSHADWLNALRTVEADCTLRGHLTADLKRMGLITVTVELTNHGAEVLKRMGK